MSNKRASFLLALLMLFPGAVIVPGEGAITAIDRAPSHFAKLDGMRIHYKTLGWGDTAVVFVHGWTCDLTFWREQGLALEGKARILLIDLPGHGQSDKPEIEYTMDRFARSIDAVLRDARVETATLVGHSMGTPVIRQFYRMFPKKTRALVFVDGRVRPLEDKTGEFKQFIARLSGPDYKDEQARLIDSMFTDKSPAEVRETVKTRMQSTPQHVAVSMMKAFFDPAIWKDDKIEVPLQVILVKSRFWSPEDEPYIRQLAPQVDYHLMEGLGHFLMMEEPKAFNEMLTSFLRNNGVLKE